MRSVVAQYSLLSGEITPQLFGRPDYKRHQTGVELARGFIPLRYGSLTRAPGTLFKGYTKDNAPARTISFKFAKNDTMRLEFTDGIMRVWQYGSLVEVGGAAYELAIPYNWTDIQRLSWSQVYDVIYFVDGNNPPQKLSRYAVDDWTIEPVVFSGGPFDDLNENKDITVQISAEDGSVGLVATGGDIFTADDLGLPFFVKPLHQKNISLWVGNEGISVGDRRRYGGNTYEVVIGSNTGVNAPTHDEGDEALTNSITWRYICSEFGIITITEVTDAQTAIGDVILTIPLGAVDDPTYMWAKSAWTPEKGYPAAIASFDRRLILAGSKEKPRRLWFPELNDYVNHAPLGFADSAFSYDVDGSEAGSQILWLGAGGNGLFIGAIGEIFRAYSTTKGEAVGQLNMAFELVASSGSENIQPIMVDGRPIYIGRGGQRVFELAYDYQSDAVVPTELSLPAEHLGQGGFSNLCWQSTPHRHFWFIRGNGELAVMVYDAREEVLGWCTVPVAGGFVEDVDVTYSPEGDRDVVTLTVLREINGVQYRCIEEVAQVFGALPGENSIGLAEHYYCAVTFDDLAGETILNVEHLDGVEVQIWTDVGQMPPQNVFDNTITLPATASRVHIGLVDDTQKIRTLDLRAQAKDGSTLGRDKQMRGAGVRCHATGGLMGRVISRELGHPDEVGGWQSVFETPVPSDLIVANSGVARLDVFSNPSKEIILEFKPVGGAPSTISNIAPIMHSGGG